MSTAQQVFDQAFSTPRNARSPAYKRGVMDCLLARLESTDMPVSYPNGSAELDAYCSGWTEGGVLASAQRGQQEAA